MVELNQITALLSDLFQQTPVKDVSVNGIQISTDQPIQRIYGGVDSTWDFFQKAPSPQHALFIVHHGLFWDGGNPSITGPMYQKVSFCMQHKAALYASHLPLDVHPEVGNNVGILQVLSLPTETKEPFGYEGKISYGWKVQLSESAGIQSIFQKASQLINQDVQLLDYGPSAIHSVAVVSGSGNKFFNEAVQQDIDLFITGEFDHPMYLSARDFKKNVLLLGHYESEQFGITSLGHFLAKRLSLEFTFLDVSPILKKNTN